MRICMICVKSESKNPPKMQVGSVRQEEVKKKGRTFIEASSLTDKDSTPTTTNNNEIYFPTKKNTRPIMIKCPTRTPLSADDCREHEDSFEAKTPLRPRLL
jgi:hypothetical protein